MLISQLIGRRFKENPAEASLISHSILLREGYIRQVANGIYSLLPLGFKVIRKIEEIVRQEMNRIGGQEVLMPVVLPRELWDESGRFENIGSELLRFKDRTDHDMVLAMTHEEAVVHLARNDAKSYKSYPFMLFQIQTKFRDEPRSRGGLVRVREFTMKDAYSFHIEQEDLHKYYEECADAYSRIFSRVGIPEVAKVESDTGMMGGRIAHEYMLLVDSGEDTIVKCDTCDYISNLEVAICKRNIINEPEQPLELVYTPKQKVIEDVSSFLSIPTSRLAKAVVFERDSQGVPVMAIIRGDLEVNEAKISKFLGIAPEPAQQNTILSIGAVPGFSSALNLSKCRIIADKSIVESSNLVCGANKTDYHYLNFNLKRDVSSFEVGDISTTQEDDNCPCCEGHLKFKRGIEVGNIFQLGSKYTDIMKMRYLDKEGKEKIPLMGCYGIGIGRLMASVIEAKHDDFGPIWPISISPFSVHILSLNLDENQKLSFSKPIYNELLEMQIEVIYDNRDERPGVQFADADLIGAPLRLIFSSKNYADKKVEWKTRNGKEKGLIDFGEVVSFVQTFLQEENQKTEESARGKRSLGGRTDNQQAK